MKITTYQEAKEYLESLIKPTIFRKIELQEAAIKNPLSRMYRLLELLGNPQKKFKAIQVSGTSGKGSTAYLISHILTTAGYKTGLSISPHLIKINERIQLNGVPISDDEFCSLLSSMVQIIELMRDEDQEPSYFEITMALSFLFFAEKKVDIAVVEVGIEGAYDASNTCEPIISVLTNIDLDHTEILGETVEEIAKEATSIIKNFKFSILNFKSNLNEKNIKQQTVVTGVKQKSVIKIVNEKAKKEGSRVLLLGKDFACERSEQKPSENKKPVFDYFDKEGELKNIKLGMMGDYQIENAAIAIKTVRSLSEFKISEQLIRSALSSAFFPGRFELVNYTLYANTYTLILDGAHNPAKMRAFISSLKFLYPKTKKIFIVGFKSNKDVSGMLAEIVSAADIIILTKYSVTPDYQGPPPAEVSSIKYLVLSIKKKSKRDVQLFSEESVGQAIEKATELATKKDLIIVTGSLYLVGETRGILVK